jgi:sulfite reductase (NADPH) hemoprotein beta-component
VFKAAKAGPAKVITANRLGDGIVVFLDDEGGWPVEIAKARILEDGPDLDGALAYAKEQHDARIIVEPYAIDVDVKDGVPVPVRLRELIRAQGPTVDYGDAERARLTAV